MDLGNALSVKPGQGSCWARPETLRFVMIRYLLAQCADRGGATALKGAWMEWSFPARRAHPQRLAAGSDSNWNFDTHCNAQPECVCVLSIAVAIQTDLPLSAALAFACKDTPVG
jgi:hypothetical protein